MSTAVHPSMTPTRATLGGSSIIMACACGAASSSMKLMAIAGIAATTKFLHPVFFGVGAALIVYGLWRTARQSAYMSVAAFAIIGAGAWLTPPGKMTMRGSEMAAGHPGIPWGATQTRHCESWCLWPPPCARTAYVSNELKYLFCSNFCRMPSGELATDHSSPSASSTITTETIAG